MPRDGDSKFEITAREVDRLPVGRHHIEGILHLDVKPNGKRYWVARFTSPVTQNQREMGLGAYTFAASGKGLTLKEARLRAAAIRHDVLIQKIDPLEAKARQKVPPPPKAMTFRAAAEKHHATKRDGWKPGYARQWLEPLLRHAYPVVGDMPAKDITVRDVRAVVDNIWSVHIDAAWQVLTRMRAVLDSAAVEEGRNGAPNPAAWRGNLEHILPRPSKVKARNGGKQHQPAMGWRAMPGFWSALKAEEGVVADCLRWTILTAVRPGEARMATLNSISASCVWTTRTKTRAEFDIPLCAAARAIMTALEPTVPRNADGSRYLFQGRHLGRVGAERRELGNPAHPPLAERATLALIERLEAEAEARQPGSSADWRDARSGRRVVVHGMRATFRTWAVRGAGAPKHLAELALAHKHETELDNAYDRETEIEARLALYEAWAAFLETGEVKPYRDCVTPELWQRLKDIGR